MEAIEVPQTLEYMGGQLNAAPVLEDFQDSPDDEEDTRSGHEYLNDLEEEYQARALLAKSKWFIKNGVRDGGSPFQPKLLYSSEHKPEPRRTKEFEAKYNKDEEEASSDDNEVTEGKALMTLTNEERVSVSKESANHGEWVKISIQKHVNTEILKDNQNLRNELKELTSITEAWLNKNYQPTEDTSSCGSKDPVFVKSLVDNSKVSITGSNKPKLSETEDSTLSIHDTGKVPSNESQRNTTDHSVVASDSLATDYDSANESSVYSTPFPPLEKMTGVEPVFRPKTIKSILKLKSTFKAETLKGITINESSSALARINKSSLASKTNLAPAGKFKNVKMEDDPPLAIVIKELNELKLQISKKKSSYSKNKNTQQVPPNSLQNRYKTQFKMNCELCGQNNHLSENCYEVLFCKKCKRTNQVLHECKSASQWSRIISLRRGINPRNPQRITKNYETRGSNVHTTSDHNDIEWFRKRETLQAKKAESFKASKNESSSALRSKTPTKRVNNNLVYRRNNCLNMECRVRRLRRNTFISYAVTGSIPINRGLIQAIPTSLPPQPIGEATKASNLRRIPPGVQGRSHFTYFLYLIVQIRIL
ncbi:hypothetical protein Tco_1041552 [Tanacetum coccineum]|uniref:Uncharacterized protein n=1 Tax=Tanacetum coccineum TaxID=301880 RepID=A0ABQ5GIX0_9ASTR